MKRHFSIAGMLNTSLILVAIASVCLAAVLLVRNEYESRINALIDDSVRLSSGDTILQLAANFRDKKMLGDKLDQFFFYPAVQYVAIRDQSGQVLVQRDRTAGGAGYDAPAFASLRRGLDSLEPGRTSRWQTAGWEQYMDVTVPVFAGVNPLNPFDSENRYSEALANLGQVESEYLSGFVHLGVNLSELRQNLVPYSLKIGLLALTFLLLFIVFTMFVTRYATAPLTVLAQLAEEIANGKLDKKFSVRGVGEARQITAMLNLILEELNVYRTKVNLDNQLLSLQVDERNQQLEKRNRELSKAVSQITVARNRLRQLAYYDSLTSLPNRQLFTEQLDLLLRLGSREDKKLAVMFVDLDNFKRINDSLGHSVGDQLLVKVADRLSRTLRDSDLVAQYVGSESRIGVSRLGGDEFTVVLNNLDTYDSAGIVAERLLLTLRKPMHVGGHELVVTPSIGIAVAPRDARTVEDILKLSDMAMYHAKTTGRNKYTFYDSAMQGAGVDRLKMETDLRKALDREEFVLYYQPQVDTRTGEIVGAEALIRWNHPEQGLVAPFQFIPLAEEMGLIVEMGAWTLMDACRQSKTFHRQGLPLPKVAVNVSSLQFNASFSTLVRNVLEDTGLDASMLEIELTEGVIMSNAQASIDALLRLKRLGVSISVDDFGTGYSSLNYLSRFPLDELKIDRSFIIELDKGQTHSTLVSAIIAMGQSLNLRLVAEGVDTVEQFRFLSDKNVDVIQGFLFSKPVPAEEFSQLLRNNPFPEMIRDMTSKPHRALASA